MDARNRKAADTMSSEAEKQAEPKPNPRGGRPKMPPHLRRSEKFECRFNVDELAQLRALAAQAGMPISDFIRIRTLKPTLTPAAPSVDKSAAISALNRAVLSLSALQEKLSPLNNNMNQIARYLHTGRGIQLDHWLEEERELLEEVRGQLNDLVARADNALKEVFKW